MADLEMLRNEIKNFSNEFRKQDLPPIEESGVYFLNKQGNESVLGWPDSYPLGNRRGVYGIFNEETLIYVGKASQQDLCYRLSDYFRYGSNRECETKPGHTWSSEPTSLVVFAVPEEMPFEASALEEYLISKLSNELKDNKIGKNA